MSQGFTGSVSEVFQVWTPTYVNLTVGNGTVVARYLESHGMVDYMFSLTFGSTSSVDGSGVTLTYPVPANSFYVSGAASHGVGYARAAATSHPVFVRDMGVTLEPLVESDSTFTRFATISATVPAVWTTGDTLQFQGRYQTG